MNEAQKNYGVDARTGPTPQRFDFRDEPYVRLYTSDPPEMRGLSWRARGLFCELTRKADFLGHVEVGDRDPAEGVAHVVSAPADEVRAPLAELFASRAIAHDVVLGLVRIAYYREAQTAAQSACGRQRKRRELLRAQRRYAALARGGRRREPTPVTPEEEEISPLACAPKTVAPTSGQEANLAPAGPPRKAETPNVPVGVTLSLFHVARPSTPPVAAPAAPAIVPPSVPAVSETRLTAQALERDEVEPLEVWRMKKRVRKSHEPKAPDAPAPKSYVGKRIDPEWRPMPSTCEWARARGYRKDEFDEAAEEFRSYWLAEGGGRARKCDWDHAFQNRLRALEALGKMEIVPERRPQTGLDEAPPQGVPPPPEALAALRRLGMAFGTSAQERVEDPDAPPEPERIYTICGRRYTQSEFENRTPEQNAELARHIQETAMRAAGQ